jgi:glycosyltransferase involved in cell wall biosynthesis
MAEPLRVLRIIARLNVGGPARHVAILDRGLRDRGYETVLVHGSPGPDEGSLEHLTRGLPTFSVPELGRRVHLSGDLRAFLQIMRLIFRFRPHVVHTHTAKAGTLGRIAAWLYNRTRRRSERALVVHTFHGHVLEGYFGTVVSRLIRTTERCLARVTDRVIVISDRQRRDLTERFAVCREDQVAVVPLGLDLDDLLKVAPAAPSFRSDAGLDRDAIVIGFIGRLVPIKDLSLLLRAFSTVAADHADTHLLVAGDGPLRSDLMRLAADLELAPRIHFIGWCRDLPRFYATCDLIALTSRNEGTPVALIEAMAAGVPAVSTAVGGVPDVIVDGVTGLLVSSRDPVHFASALGELVTDPARRRMMGSMARRTVAERFSSERLLGDMDRLYRGCRAAAGEIHRRVP